MEYISIPSIVVLCYLAGEFVKLITKKNELVKRLMPVTVGILGAILGALIFIYYPTYIMVNTIFEAMALGVISGLASTGSNQILKQLLKGKNKNEEEFFWDWI